MPELRDGLVKAVVVGILDDVYDLFALLILLGKTLRLRGNFFRSWHCGVLRKSTPRGDGSRRPAARNPSR